MPRTLAGDRSLDHFNSGVGWVPAAQLQQAALEFLDCVAVRKPFVHLDYLPVGRLTGVPFFYRSPEERVLGTVVIWSGDRTADRERPLARPPADVRHSGLLAGRGSRNRLGLVAIGDGRNGCFWGGERRPDGDLRGYHHRHHPGKPARAGLVRNVDGVELEIGQLGLR